MLLFTALLFIATCRASDSQDDPLTQIYKTYNEVPGFHHWLEYGKCYDDNIKHLRSKKMVNMLEIGVQSGGSTRVWNQYWGPGNFRYVGIDINKTSKQFESPSENIFVEIGSQLDPVFLKNICQKFGPFDFIVDDGGHTTEMMKTSFDALWDCVTDDGIYVIEDTHTMSMWAGRNGMLVDGKDIFGHVADLLRKQVHYNKGFLVYREPDPVGKHIKSISTYDSLIFIRRQEQFKRLTEIRKGEKFIPY